MDKESLKQLKKDHKEHLTYVSDCFFCNYHRKYKIAKGIPNNYIKDKEIKDKEVQDGR